MTDDAETVRRVLEFLKCVICSGESWSETCDRMREQAEVALLRLSDSERALRTHMVAPSSYDGQSGHR